MGRSFFLDLLYGEGGVVSIGKLPSFFSDFGKGVIPTHPDMCTQYSKKGLRIEKSNIKVVPTASSRTVKLWGFYLVLAVAFGFMLHVRKQSRQKYSEACRPILSKYTDGIAGRVIDFLAVFALLAGTATTFSVATPPYVKHHRKNV